MRRDAAINRTEAALAALANDLILQLRLTCSRLRLTCSRLRGDLVAKDDLNDRPWHAPSVAEPRSAGTRCHAVLSDILLVGREPTAWLTMQSAANQSPAANSLLTGKLTGNFAEPGHLSQFSYPIDARIQWLTAEFPTQPNREFLKCISGNLFRETGKSSQATAKPLTCAVRTPCVHHRADANAFR